jgi:hypothetical protein
MPTRIGNLADIHIGMVEPKTGNDFYNDDRPGRILECNDIFFTWDLVNVKNTLHRKTVILNESRAKRNRLNQGYGSSSDVVVEHVFHTVSGPSWILSGFLRRLARLRKRYADQVRETYPLGLVHDKLFIKPDLSSFEGDNSLSYLLKTFWNTHSKPTLLQGQQIYPKLNNLRKIRDTFSRDYLTQIEDYHPERSSINTIVGDHNGKTTDRFYDRRERAQISRRDLRNYLAAIMLTHRKDTVFPREYYWLQKKVIQYFFGTIPLKIFGCPTSKNLFN